MRKLFKMNRFIALLQIVGGAIGVVLYIVMLPRIFGAFEVSLGFFINLIIVLFGLVLFGFSIFAGILLWKNKRSGFFVSFLVQLFQVVQFKSLSFAYAYIVGAGALFFIGFQGLPKVGFSLHLNPYLGSNYQLIFGPYQEGPITITINLLALFFAVYLYKQYKKN